MADNQTPPPLDQATVDSGEFGVAVDASVDIGKFVLDIVCPDGSKPDLASMPNCKTLLDRLLKDCCPNPNQEVNTKFAGMVCFPNADEMCKMGLASGFQVTCQQMKTSPSCT